MKKIHLPGGKKKSIVQLQHSFLLSYLPNLVGRKNPKTLFCNWDCHVDMAKKATCALRVELIRTETQSLVKGTCHKMQNMNYFHRNTQQFKKSDSQGINICLKNKSQSSVMNYVLLYFICYKGTVLETWALPHSSSPRMTPEANQVTSEHTCLVTTRSRAAKSRTGDLASQYSQLFNGSQPPLKWHFLARIPQQWGFFHLIKSTTFPLDTQRSCDTMCRWYLPLSITES